MKKAIYALAAGAILVSSCAVTQLDPAAQSVKTVSESAAKSCTFLDSVSENNRNTLSKDPQADARARAYNRVAQLGGNSLLIKSTDTKVSPSGVGSIFTLQGEAYRC